MLGMYGARKSLEPPDDSPEASSQPSGLDESSEVSGL